MAYSLGLTLYNLGIRGTAATAQAFPGRPEGHVIWLNVPGADCAQPALALARRLSQGLGVTVVVTAPAGLSFDDCAVRMEPPVDLPGPARAFLDHWQPAIGILFEGEVRPSLLHEAQERGIPVILVEARTPSLPKGRDGWWPGLLRATLAQLRLVLAVDEPSARSFRKAGAIPGAVEAAGRMELPSAALPCNEAERAELSAFLSARPVWLAACVPEAEETAVISAHRALLRLTHRLLLLAIPEDPARAPVLARKMEEVEGWAVARRASDEIPDAETQVFIADAAEYGLWYRLAPVTYLGGSLSAGGCRVDPLEPASLGSAIVHGPRGGAYGAVIGRLAAAQGAALVGSASDLAEAAAELLAPDRAARMASAAWQVATEGTEVTERVVEIVRAALVSQPQISGGQG